MIEVFSRPTCPGCNVLKQELVKHNISYVERVLDVDVSVADFKLRFPDQKTIPVIAVNDNVIAGIDELLVLISRNQLQYL